MSQTVPIPNLIVILAASSLQATLARTRVTPSGDTRDTPSGDTRETPG